MSPGHHAYTPVRNVGGSAGLPSARSEATLRTAASNQEVDQTLKHQVRIELGLGSHDHLEMLEGLPRSPTPVQDRRGGTDTVGSV
jgi:hypothetical protein